MYDWKTILEEIMKEVYPSTILYHVTPFIEEIKKEGLRTKRITGNSIFGNVGALDEDTISVTYDYGLAKNYQKGLSYFIQACKDELDIMDLYRIIKEYNPHYSYQEKLGQEVDICLIDYDINFYNREAIIFLIDNGLDLTDRLIKDSRDSFIDKLDNTKKENLKDMDIEGILSTEMINKIIVIGLQLLGHYGKFPWIVMDKGLNEMKDKFSKLEEVGIIRMHVRERIQVEDLIGEKEVRIKPELLVIDEYIL